MTSPLNPPRQVHLLGTSIPELFPGQLTGAQVEIKYGAPTKADVKRVSRDSSYVVVKRDVTFRRKNKINNNF